MSFTVKHLDCFDFMDSINPDSVDLILTDPPYNISRETGFKNTKLKKFSINMDFGSWDHAEIDLKALSQNFFRILKNNGTAIVFYDLWKIGKLKEHLEQVGFKMFRQIIWQKTNPVPINQKATYLSNSREVAVVCVKSGNPTFNSEYDSGVYSYPIPQHEGGRVHPTQKPLILFENLIIKHSNKNDLVIDPFLGAGTTGVASIKNFRRFSGCDIDCKYAEISHKEIENTYLHGRQHSIF